ncbi:MAG: D-alanyl-D-alanine carboxypeptidase family protein [bacterium]|nr:D-alanyl-D-alanine carboxypeptidase family protein [bacterium]
MCWIWLIFFCLCFGNLTGEGLIAYAEEEKSVEEKSAEALRLYARAAVLLDAKTGRVLYGQNEEEVLPMASTTKIMTCILALEHGNLRDKVKISAYAASQPDVQLNAREGEEYYLEDLLYSLMLESHNDSAVAIAEHIGGSVEAFAELMNQKARELGCYDTHFVTPNGLDAVDAQSGESHATTAQDLAEILRYCVLLSPQKEAFMSITRTTSRTFSDCTGKHAVSCQNHNALLTMMEGVLSGKTGFTNKAGYCYVGAVEKEEKTMIVALLGCGWPPHKTYKWSDVRKLLQYGFENYSYQSLDTPEAWSKEKLIFPLIEVMGGKTKRIGESAWLHVKLQSKPFRMLLREGEEVELVWKVSKQLTAPVQSGTTVGCLEYRIDGVTWKSDLVVTEGSVEATDFKWCLQKVLEQVLPAV